MKKIYLLEIYFDYDNIHIHLNDSKEFNQEYDAIRVGVNKLKELFNDCKTSDFSYQFSILETFNINEKLNYDINSLKDLSNEKLYDALLYISNGKKSYYDYNGNLLCIEKMNNDHYNSFSFKSLLGYHATKFNIGDKVRFKYANNKTIGIIVGKYNNIGTIYDSNDPYHFKEGYNVEYTIDGYTTYNENWQEPYYDEDLESVKD